MFTLFIVLLVLLTPLVAPLAVLVIAALITSVTALFAAVLPVRRVPLRYNLRNLQVRMLPALLTTSSVTLVVALLIWMLSFVQGMAKLTEASGHAGNVLILSDGATDEAFSNLPGGFSFELLPSDLQKYIEKTSAGEFLAAKEVYVICTHMLPNPEASGRKRRFVQMRGLDNPRIAALLHEIELAEGEWFSQTGVPEVVLGDGVAKSFAKDYGKEALRPGDMIEIGPKQWKVTGIMKPTGSSFGSEVWTHDQIVQKNFGRENSYTCYVVRTKDARTAEMASKGLKEFRSERALAAAPEREYYAKLTTTQNQFSGAIRIVAIIMAIGGALGVMITMFAAVSQRSKDIGVLRILGYTRWAILNSFQLESLFIGLIGGILGCAIGYGVFDGLTATSIVSSGQGGGKTVVLKFVVDAGIIVNGMVLALLMGAVGGFVPSFMAMRLRPLESLR